MQDKSVSRFSFDDTIAIELRCPHAEDKPPVYAWMNGTQVHMHLGETYQLFYFFDEDNAAAYLEHELCGYLVQRYKETYLPLADSPIEEHAFGTGEFTIVPDEMHPDANQLQALKHWFGGEIPGEFLFALKYGKLPSEELYLTNLIGSASLIVHAYCPGRADQTRTILQACEYYKDSLPKGHVPIALDEDRCLVLLNQKGRVFLWEFANQSLEVEDQLTLLSDSFGAFSNALMQRIASGSAHSEYWRPIWDENLERIQKYLDDEDPVLRESTVRLEFGISCIQLAIREDKASVLELLLKNDVEVEEIPYFPRKFQTVKVLEDHGFDWTTFRKRSENITLTTIRIHFGSIEA